MKQDIEYLQPIRGSDSVSIIDLNNANAVTNLPLAPSGGHGPICNSI